MAERVELADGYSISRVVNGLWQISAGHRRRGHDRGAVLRDLRRLVEAGLTTFDCADIYTGVEEILGELRRSLGPAGEIQVHTKYVPDLTALSTITRRDVQRAVERSLRRLAVDRLDLVQFAWWDYGVPRYVEVAGWLDEQRRAGKIRLLGTTNFDTPRLRELLEAGLPIAAHQVQYSLLDRRVESSLAELCSRNGIHLLCYGSAAGGFLSRRWLGTARPEDPLANRSLTKYRLVIDEFGGWSRHQELLSVLSEIAARHDASPTGVAVRWVLDRPGVAAVLLGTRDASHLPETLGAFGLGLDAEDRARLDSVLRRATGPQGEPFELERKPGGRHARIMKTDLNRKVGVDLPGDRSDGRLGPV